MVGFIASRKWRGPFTDSQPLERNHHGVLSEVLKQAVEWRLAVRNAAQAVAPPRPEETEMTTVSPEEVPFLLQEARRLEFNSGLA